MKTYFKSLSIILLNCLFLSACIEVTEPEIGDPYMGGDWLVVSDRPDDLKNILNTSGTAFENGEYGVDWRAESYGEKIDNTNMNETKDIPLLAVGNLYWFTDHEVSLYRGANSFIYRTIDMSDDSVMSTDSFNVYKQRISFRGPELIDEPVGYACVWLADGRQLMDQNGILWYPATDGAYSCGVGAILYTRDYSPANPGIYPITLSDQFNEVMNERIYQLNYIDFSNLIEDQDVNAVMYDGQAYLVPEQLAGQIGFVNPDGTQTISLCGDCIDNCEVPFLMDETGNFEPVDPIPVYEGDCTLQLTLEDSEFNGTLTETVNITVHVPYIEITWPVDGFWYEWNSEGSNDMAVVIAHFYNLDRTMIDSADFNGEPAIIREDVDQFQAVVPLPYGVVTFTASLTLKSPYNTTLTDSVTVYHFTQDKVVFDPLLETCEMDLPEFECLQGSESDSVISGTKSYSIKVQEGRPALTYVITAGITDLGSINLTTAELQICDDNNDTINYPCNALAFYRNIKNNGYNTVLAASAVAMYPWHETFRKNHLALGYYLNLGFIFSIPILADGEVSSGITREDILDEVEDTNTISINFGGFKPFVGIYMHDENIIPINDLKYHYSQIKGIDSTLVTYAIWMKGSSYSPGSALTVEDCIATYEVCPTEDVTLVEAYSTWTWLPDSKFHHVIDYDLKVHQSIINPATGKPGNAMVLHGVYSGREQSRSGNWTAWRMPMEGSIEISDNRGSAAGGIGSGYWAWGGLYPDYFWCGYNRCQDFDLVGPNKGLYGLYDVLLWLTDPSNPPVNPDPIGIAKFDLLEDARYNIGSSEIEQPGYLTSIGSSDPNQLPKASALDKTYRDFTGVGLFKDRTNLYPDPGMDGITQWRWDPGVIVTSTCYQDFSKDFVSDPERGNIFRLTYTINKYGSESGLDLMENYQLAEPGKADAIFDCESYSDTAVCDTEKINEYYIDYYKILPTLPDIPTSGYTAEEIQIIDQIRPDVQNWLLVNFPSQCVAGTGPGDFEVLKRVDRWPNKASWLYSNWRPPLTEGVYVLNFDSRTTLPGQPVILNAQWWGDYRFVETPITADKQWQTSSGLIHIYLRDDLSSWEWWHTFLGLQLWWTAAPHYTSGAFNGWRNIEAAANAEGKDIEAYLELDNIRFWELDIANEVAPQIPSPTSDLYKYYFEPFRYLPGEIPMGNTQNDVLKYDAQNIPTDQFAISGWYIPEISSRTTGVFTLMELAGTDGTGNQTRAKITYENLGSCNPTRNDPQCLTVGYLKLNYGYVSGPDQTLSVPIAFEAGLPVFWAFSVNTGQEQLFVAGSYGNTLNIEEGNFVDLPANSNWEFIHIGSNSDGSGQQEGYSSMVKGYNEYFDETTIIEEIYKCGGYYSHCLFE